MHGSSFRGSRTEAAEEAPCLPGSAGVNQTIIPYKPWLKIKRLEGQTAGFASVHVSTYQGSSFVPFFFGCGEPQPHATTVGSGVFLYPLGGMARAPMG